MEHHPYQHLPGNEPTGDQCPFGGIERSRGWLV